VEAVGEIVVRHGRLCGFDVPRNMNYDDPYQDLSIHIEKGYQLLDGEGAMGVLRYRHDNDLRYGYPDGDPGAASRPSRRSPGHGGAAPEGEKCHQDQRVHQGVPG
jgi:hypothetical protein